MSLSVSAYETVALRRRLQESETIPSPPAQSNSGRPKMHTFFTPISQTPDTALLEVWKKSWSDAGWEPVVLTLADAKKHPIYRRFIETFDTSGDTAKYRLTNFDRMCFLRWLAMASSGGGWMSDYDTLPLFSSPEIDGHNLPNNGKFTCYSGHVPNLVSGSEQEWNRMAQLLLFSYKSHQDIFWSDMLALLESHDYIDGYVYQQDTISLKKVYIQELASDIGIQYPFALGKRCEVLKGKRAVHFSETDCQAVGFCDGERTKAEPWINAWKEKCDML